MKKNDILKPPLDNKTLIFRLKALNEKYNKLYKIIKNIINAQSIGDFNELLKEAKKNIEKENL